MVSSNSAVRRKHLIRRTTFLSASLLLILAVPLMATITQPIAVQAQSAGDLWNEPVNLSVSGSTSMLVSAGEPNGQAQVMWWDKFDGAQYTYLKTDGTWSKPVTVTGIYGQRTRGPGGRIDITPPLDLKLLTSANNQVFVFWRVTNGDLMYARTDSRNPKWSGGVRLITNPLVWTVSIAPDNSLNLAYVRASATSNVQPGIYFRRSKDGTSWSDAVAVTTSLYFRTLPAASATLSVVAFGQRQVLVGWDDPQTLQSYQARSITTGSKFEPPELVEAGGIAEVAIPKHIRYLNMPNAGLLRLWEAGDSCVLYQQALDQDTWTAPVRVLEKVNGCLRSTYTYPTSDGRLFMTIGATATTRGIITAWDGVSWADPLTPQVAFINPSTDSLVALDCENLLLAKDTVIMVGCDQQGDVWVLTSQVAAPDFLPLAASEWGHPLILSRGDTDVSVPNVAVDQQNRFHVVWSQAASLGAPGDTLVYIRGDGNTWTDPAVISNGLGGAIESPNLIADPNQVLHLVWSGGPTGQVQYNQAFMRDALIAADWGDVQSLPAVRPVGDSPEIILSPTGKLYAVYAIPFNEDRGLYLTSSSDLGVTWAPVTRIFDAAAANWGVIHEVQLVVDQQDQLHVVWSRAASPDQESPQGIYYSRSRDGGATWTEALEISSDPDNEPRLAISSDNILHLVWAHTTLNGHELLHQWSPDGGQTWSTRARVPDLGVVVAGTGLVADTNGSLYLVGMELTRETSAAIFYLRWDGQTWTNRDSLRLGYDFREGMNVTAAILPSGQLGVFYRVWAPVAGSGAHYVAGYVGRSVNTNTDFVPVPTFTPRPPPTHLPAATAEPTLTPSSPIDLTTQNTDSGNTVWIEISGIVLVMIVISAIAIFRLSGRVGR